jgi:hypothetical protein
MNKKDWKDTFSNKKILLIGGGESALDIGNLAFKYSKKIYFTTRSHIEWFPDWGLSKDFLNKNKSCNDKNLFGLGEQTPSDTHLSYLEYSLPTPVSGFWHLFGRNILVSLYKKSKIKCVHNNKKLCDITGPPKNLFAKPVRIKNGRQKYYNNLLSIKEKSDFLLYYAMFIVFNSIFLLIIFFITLLIYKYIMVTKKINYTRFIVIYIVLIYLIYNFML